VGNTLQEMRFTRRGKPCTGKRQLDRGYDIRPSFLIGQQPGALEVQVCVLY
jgi:hypothetical protein